MIKKWIKGRILKYISDFKDLDGWLTEREAMGLFLLAFKAPRNAKIVEIGSWQGKSTYCLSKGLRSGKVYAIDPFNADGGLDKDSEKIYAAKKGTDNLYDKFIDNMTRLKVRSKIVAKQGYSYQFPDEFDKIDVLFIDGDHSIEGCKLDFDLFSPKVAVGGYIAFHDYDKTRDELGPTYVIQNIVLNSLAYEYYRQYDSLWVAKKIA
jgi:hypothetical protein